MRKRKDEANFNKSGERVPGNGEVYLNAYPGSKMVLGGASCFTSENHGFVLYSAKNGEATGYDRFLKKEVTIPEQNIIIKVQ
nr:MAG TPA: hypothetical protein [Caudoviricetes sp.]